MRLEANESAKLRSLRALAPTRLTIIDTRLTFLRTYTPYPSLMRALRLSAFAPVCISAFTLPHQ